MIGKMVEKVLGTHLLAGKKRQYVWTKHITICGQIDFFEIAHSNSQILFHHLLSASD